MSIEESVLQRLRSLPEEKKKAVLRFVESLEIAPAPKPPLQSLHGIWKHLDVDLTKEDIDLARREAWSNFPREFPK